MCPELNLGPLALRIWPVLTTGGVVLCWILLLRRTGRLGYDRTRVFLWVLLGFPAGAVGAALLERLTWWIVGGAGAAESLGAGGFTVLGSVVGCLAFTYLYIPKVFGEPAGRLLDAVAFTWPLALAIGRIGCLCNGCCFGAPAGDVRGVLRALTLRAGDYARETPAGDVYAALHPDARVWNLPLLLLGNALLVLLVTELVYARREKLGFPPGGVMWLGLGVWSAGRFLVEFARQSQTLGSSGINPWQLIVASTGVAALTVFSIGLHRSRRAAGNSLDGSDAE